MKKRVLIVRSNPISPDPRVEKEARALQLDGYQVQALGWDRSGSLPQKDDRAGFECVRISLRAGYGRGLGNLPQLLRWQWRLWRWLIQHRREFDVIHACDFDTILPALWCKTFLGKWVVYDIFDFYADHLRSTPKWIVKIIRAVDLWSIGQADGVILVDDARKKQIAGSRPRRLEVIYNSPEDVCVSGGEERKQRQGGLLLAYVGLLQMERGLLEMFHVLQRHPDWHLELAGFGGDEEKILDLVRPMTNVTWHGRVSYEQALGLSQSADVLFATYDPAIPNHRYSSPNKVFEAMMLGKPVIVARDTNVDQIIETYGCGVVVPYGDEQALEEALARLADEVDWRLSLGQNARRAYEERFGWEQMRKKLRSFYDAITC
jgi:glycosyltransferase involved in cell wall biosynthesis